MNYSQYFVIEKKLNQNGFDVDRKELLEEYSKGDKTSLKELTPHEYKEFLNWVQTLLNNPLNSKSGVNNNMRRKVIALFVHKMDYTMESLDNWCLIYGKHKKRLNDHNYNELVDLVTQAERTYASYVNTL